MKIEGNRKRKPAENGYLSGEESNRYLGTKGKPFPIEIDPKAPVSDHFKAALDRIDGITMYIVVAIFLITAMVFLLKIILLDTHTERDEIILTASLCMVPISIVFYFKQTIINDSKIISAMMLLGGTVYFFYIFFLK